MLGTLYAIAKPKVFKYATLKNIKDGMKWER
jgi:hypothetical protein